MDPGGPVPGLGQPSRQVWSGQGLACGSNLNGFCATVLAARERVTGDGRIRPGYLTTSTLQKEVQNLVSQLAPQAGPTRTLGRPPGSACPVYGEKPPAWPLVPPATGRGSRPRC